ERIAVGDLVELGGGRVDVGVGGVDAVDAVLGHQDDVATALEGALDGHGVGGEEGHAHAGAEDHDAALLHVADRATRDVGLGDLPHGDGGLHAGLDTHALQEVLEGQAVHHDAEHAHVVGAHAVHATLLQLSATEEVATAG